MTYKKTPTTLAILAILSLGLLTGLVGQALAVTAIEKTRTSSCSSSSQESNPQGPTRAGASFNGAGSCSTSSAGYSSQTIERNPTGGITVSGPDTENRANGGIGSSCSAVSGPSVTGGEERAGSGSVSCSSHAEVRSTP